MLNSRRYIDIGGNGRKYVEENHDIRKIVEQYKTVFQEFR
jgi:hypothetical protein